RWTTHNSPERQAIAVPGWDPHQARRLLPLDSSEAAEYGGPHRDSFPFHEPELRSSRRKEAQTFWTKEIRASLRRLLRFMVSMRVQNWRSGLPMNWVGPTCRSAWTRRSASLPGLEPRAHPDTAMACPLGGGSGRAATTPPAQSGRLESLSAPGGRSLRAALRGATARSASRSTT